MTQEFINTLNLLISKWENEKIQLNTGISNAHIEKLESDLGFCFGEEFKYYLQKANGFIGFYADEAWFCFWSDTRIKEENKDGTHPGEVIWFADHSLNLCSFGFHKTDKKIYTHFDKQDKIMLIAESFNDFIDVYIDNPFRLIL
jgi:hypothetical protein